MGVFDKEIRLFRDIHEEVHQVIIDSIRKYDFVLLDFQTNKQMNVKGQTSTGKQIGMYQRERYKRYRISKGLQVDHVDLKLTGKFQSTLELITENDQFVIKAHVDYADDLVEHYGPEILGIQRTYLEQFVNNYLIAEIRKMVNIKLKVK